MAHYGWAGWTSWRVWDVFTYLDRWPKRLRWMGRKGPKIVESRPIMCRAPSFWFACSWASAPCPGGVGGAISVTSYLKGRPPHTHHVTHTFIYVASTLSHLDHPKTLVTGAQILEILWTALLFIFKAFWKQLQKYQDLWKRLILLHFQPDCKLREVEILQAYFPEIPVRTAPAISWLYTWPQNSTISSSKSICFFSFSSSLTFKHAVKSSTIAPQAHWYPDLQIWVTMRPQDLKVRGWMQTTKILCPKIQLQEIYYQQHTTISFHAG